MVLLCYDISSCYYYDHGKGGRYAVATVVKKRPGESEDSLISRFRKKIQSERLINLLKEKQYYKKKSEEKAERMQPIRRAKKRRRRR